VVFSIAFVPGVTVAKWTRLWDERRPETPLVVIPVPVDEQTAVLHDGRADLSFVRLPAGGDGLSLIRLYEEVAVLVVSSDHAIADLESLTVADLAGLQLHEHPASIPDAIELVAAGVGAIVVPHAIARLHARKDVVARPITDAEKTQIGIAWPADATTQDVEEFVGIVRGRSAQSSRGAQTPEAVVQKTAPAKAAQKKTPAKPARHTFVPRSTAKPNGKRRRQGR
jgi:DNA-binding transcriptional LysR family regulator